MAAEGVPWEASKENVMPIERGRKVGKLNAVLSERCVRSSRLLVRLCTLCMSSRATHNAGVG